MDRLTRLLLDAQSGDRAALGQFVAETEHDVRTLCRHLGDADNADDLAQATYERALRSLHRYRAEGPAKHWLLTIARRTCVDATRSRIRQRRLRQAVAQQPIEPNTDAAPLATDWGGLIDQLDDDRRAAFVVTQLNGLRYDEAAELLEVPIGTIRSRVARAREQLVELVAAAENAASGELELRRQRPGM